MLGNSHSSVVRSTHDSVVERLRVCVFRYFVSCSSAVHLVLGLVLPCGGLDADGVTHLVLPVAYVYLHGRYVGFRGVGQAEHVAELHLALQGPPGSALGELPQYVVGNVAPVPWHLDVVQGGGNPATGGSRGIREFYDNVRRRLGHLAGIFLLGILHATKYSKRLCPPKVLLRS